MIKGLPVRYKILFFPAGFLIKKQSIARQGSMTDNYYPILGGICRCAKNLKK